MTDEDEMERSKKAVLLQHPSLTMEDIDRGAVHCKFSSMKIKEIIDYLNTLNNGVEQLSVIATIISGLIQTCDKERKPRLIKILFETIPKDEEIMKEHQELMERLKDE